MHSIPKLRGHKERSFRGKVTALTAYIKNSKRSHANDLTAHLKALNKKKQTHPREVDERK